VKVEGAGAKRMRPRCAFAYTIGEAVEQRPTFAADRMLARLARWLRLLGADTLWEPATEGAAMLRRSRAEGRAFLTRDKRFRTAADVVFIRSNDFRGQIREVLARLPFDPIQGAFTRCAVCNSPLAEVSREALARRVPPFVYANNERFVECPRCGRVYWGGTHPERILREIAAMGLGAEGERRPSADVRRP
jgi:uncharacterized protein